MPFVGIRELSRRISPTLTRLEQDGLPVIITNHGRPVAALVAVDQHNLEELVLAATPEAARRRQEAEEAVLAGHGRHLEDVQDQDEDEFDDALDPVSTAAIVAHLRPAYAKVLGWEPSDELLAAAADSLGKTVGSVMQTIRPDHEDAREVTKRVEQLNTDLYTRLWAHRFNGAVRDRLDEITREPGANIGAVVGEDVVQDTVRSAAYQLRAINQPLVASRDLTINAYEACFKMLASFDDMAHHAHASTAITVEEVA